MVLVVEDAKVILVLDVVIVMLVMVIVISNGQRSLSLIVINGTILKHCFHPSGSAY